jgi:capsular polysaccharide export protein
MSDENTKFLFLTTGSNSKKLLKKFAVNANINAKYLNLKILFGIPTVESIKFFIDNNISIKEALLFQEKRMRIKNYPKIIRMFLKLFRIANTFLTFCGLYNISKKNEFDVVVTWGGIKYTHHRIAKQFFLAKKTKMLFLERGCLPNTIIVDQKGINYDNSLPRDINFYKNYEKEANLPKYIQPRKTRKKLPEEITLPKSYIFVPFQVRTDSQILLQSPWIHTMNYLYSILERSIKLLPGDMVYVIKEHPSCNKSCYKDLHKKNKRIIFANGNVTHDLIESSEAVITINSSVGVEAMILNKKVLTLGNAFYALEGLTLSAKNEIEFHDKLISLFNWKQDKVLTRKYLNYIVNEYLIPRGDDPEVYKILRSRIMKCLSS